ncbi:hypothetical protein ES703_114803 [subsurface metagenome]
MKQCSKCKKIKPLSQFYKNSNSRDGYGYYCRECASKYGKEYRRESFSERKRNQKYHQINEKRNWEKDKNKLKRCTRCDNFKPLSEFYKCLSKKTGYNSHCKKCKAKYMREYRRTHRKELNKKNREWIHSHRDKVKEYRRKYDQLPASEKARIKANHKRKAAMMSCEVNDLTSIQVRILLAESVYCGICGKFFNQKRKKTLDHIIPISKGGNHTSVNMQVVCRTCNSEKGDKDYTEFTGGQLLLFT